jgi:hypothetical protein
MLTPNVTVIEFSYVYNIMPLHIASKKLYVCDSASPAVSDALYFVSLCGGLAA